ncbi:MAG: DUF420 domain-containing protein [Flavobacteriales bacterium]
MQANKKIERAIWVFTAVVFILVLSLHEIQKAKLSWPMTKGLPMVNAMINGTCFVLLILSLLMIRQKNIAMHKRLNTTAMILSVLFLLSYVVYHVFNADTKYEGDQVFLYYFILFSHIILAAVSLPMILFAYYHGLTNNIQKHKNLVRWTYPIWLYVTLSGVLVYVFLAPYYK